jgi:hypothetical protein
MGKARLRTRRAVGGVVQEYSIFITHNFYFILE